MFDIKMSKQRHLFNYIYIDTIAHKRFLNRKQGNSIRKYESLIQMK